MSHLFIKSKPNMTCVCGSPSLSITIKLCFKLCLPSVKVTQAVPMASKKFPDAAVLSIDLPNFISLSLIRLLSTKLIEAPVSSNAVKWCVLIFMGNCRDLGSQRSLSLPSDPHRPLAVCWVVAYAGPGCGSWKTGDSDTVAGSIGRICCFGTDFEFFFYSYASAQLCCGSS